MRIVYRHPREPSLRTCRRGAGPRVTATRLGTLFNGRAASYEDEESLSRVPFIEKDLIGAALDPTRVGQKGDQLQSTDTGEDRYRADDAQQSFIDFDQVDPLATSGGYQLTHFFRLDCIHNGAIGHRPIAHGPVRIRSRGGSPT